jgi:AmmeMemoRadiSam system protein A/AmmeMemoRadiSam system protein B
MVLDGYSLPKYVAFETPLGLVPLCPEADALRDGALLRDVREADRGEHSLELQLPWLQETLGSFCIVPILVGLTNVASERALAQRLAGLPQRDTLFVISSDFVHYGARFSYTPFGLWSNTVRERVFELENQAIDLLHQRDSNRFRDFVTKTSATICGYRGQLVLLELLKLVAPDAEAITFAHYSSTELSDERDEGTSVGYASLGFVDKGLSVPNRPLRAPTTTAPCADDAAFDEALGKELIQLAKATLSTKLRGTDALRSALYALPPTQRLDCRQAVFVTLRAHGQLRGCVGQVEPDYPLFVAVVHAAVDAALNDRRFDPVTPAELPELSFEVTILSMPREVATYGDIVLGKHGIILSAAGRRALFLPQVPGEQGWGLEQTLRALSNKAGLPDNAWEAPETRFSVFTGRVFEESIRAQSKGDKP